MSGRRNPALDPVREQIGLRFDANPYRKCSEIATELLSVFPAQTYNSLRSLAMDIRKERRNASEAEFAPDVFAITQDASEPPEARAIPTDDGDAVVVAPCSPDDTRIVERIARDAARAVERVVGDIERAATLPGHVPDAGNMVPPEMNTPPVPPVESAPVSLKSDNDDDPTIAGLSRELHRMRRELHDLKHRHSAVVAASSDSLAIVDAIRDTVAPLPAARPRMVRHPNKRTRTAVILASDWHATEQVWPDGVRGINAYNMDICARRAWALAAKQRAWLEDVSRQWDIDRCVVAILGDMNSGNIHEELAETNEVDIGRGVVWTGALIGEYLWQLAERTRLEVVAVPGNHGRLSKKPKAKVPTESLDWIAYAYARERLRDMVSDGWVKWELGSTWVETFTAQQRLFVITHGHQIKGQLGIPYYGMKRFAADLARQQQIADERALRARRDIETIGIYRILVGHFHGFAMVGDTVVNGCLPGVNEFSMTAGMSPVESLQVGFLIDPAWGMCGEEQFIVNDAPEPHGFALPDVAHREAA